MKWIKRAVLGIFLAAAAVIGVLGFTKYQARQAEAKAAEETSRKKEQIKEIYTTEYQEAVKKRLETAKESGTYTTEKMLVEQNPFGTNTLSLYVYFATEEPVSVSYVVSVPDSEIAAVNELGMVEQVYDLGNYQLHHDYVFDDDGNLLILATDTGKQTVEDCVLKLNPSTGEVSCILDLEDLLGDYKESLGMDQEEELDWIHINTIQWMGEESFWEGTGYENLLLTKDESNGSFSSAGGQHTVTYVTDDSLPDGQYYLYLFNNNLGYSESRPDYDWSQIDQIATDLSSGTTSYYYKYKVDENAGTYTLVQSFEVPFSGYVSSAQECEDTILVDSGMQGLIGEYKEDGTLVKQFQMNLSKYYIYRVYKYDFSGYLFTE